MALCFGVSNPLSAAAPDSAPWPIVLRSQVTRLNVVGYRLARTAAPLCPSTGAGTGLALDYIAAYEDRDRAAVSTLLGMTEAPQVAAVAPDSPGAKAGIRPGDSIEAIDGISTRQLARASKDPTLLADELEQMLVAKAVDETIHLQLLRDGKMLQADIAPEAVCSPRFVIKTGAGNEAHTDGENIAVSNELIGFTRNDDELALVVAHEIGHVINRDGKAGSLAERRQMEDLADIMGVRLSHCAGYDPLVGVQYWLRSEARDMLRWFRDPTHRSRPARVKRMRAEAAVATCPASVDYTQVLKHER